MTAPRCTPKPAAPASALVFAAASVVATFAAAWALMAWAYDRYLERLTTSLNSQESLI